VGGSLNDTQDMCQRWGGVRVLKWFFSLGFFFLVSFAECVGEKMVTYSSSPRTLEGGDGGSFG